MVDAVAVSDQSVGDTAEIKQAIPVGIVARHAGDFEAEYDANMAERHFCDHAGEPRALSKSRAGHTQVFVDDDHLFFGPTQLVGFLGQSILASRGFAVVLHLCRTGLANVDERHALDMAGFYFARIIHRSCSFRGRLEWPGP